MKFIYFNILLLITITLNSCDYLAYLKQESEVIITEVNVDDYSQIIIKAPYKIVFIDTADTNTITIEGMEHLLADIDISAEDNILTLDHEKRDYIQKKKRPTIYISANSFSKMTVNNIVTFSCETPITTSSVSFVVNGRGSYSEGTLSFYGNKLDFRCYSANQVGDYYFDGECENLYFNLEGCVNFYGEDLHVNNATIDHRSIGNCYITANQKLNIRIYTKGNTYYYGDPEITTSKITGTTLDPSGNVYCLNE